MNSLYGCSFARIQGMNEPIIIVNGSKGGVGKSLTTMALLDHLF